MSRHENGVSSEGGKRNASEVKVPTRQRATDSNMSVSKESTSKVPSQRVIAERHSKTSTSKTSSLNHPQEAVKPAAKSRSDTNVGNRIYSKEQPKSVLSTKPPQAVAKSKVKPSAELKSSPRISGEIGVVRSQSTSKFCLIS